MARGRPASTHLLKAGTLRLILSLSVESLTQGWCVELEPPDRDLLFGAGANTRVMEEAVDQFAPRSVVCADLAPWRAPDMAKTILWQGAGRSFSDAARIRRVFDEILRMDVDDMRAYHRACAANLLTRRDLSFRVLSQDDLHELGRRAAYLILRAPRKDGYKVNFGYSLQLAGGLLRHRISDSYAWLPDLDPVGRELENALETVRTDIDRRLARSHDYGLRRRRQQVDELLKFLVGSGGDPDLLRALEQE